MIPFALVLALSGVGFVLLERFAPRQPGGLTRKGLALDLVYLVFNAEIAGSLVAIWLASQWPAERITAWRGKLGIEGIGQQAAVVQLLVLWVVKDLVEW